MSNGQNTQNITLAVSLLAQLLAQAGSVIGTIQTAQASGTDVTDDQLAQMNADFTAAQNKLQADIDAMPDDASGTKVAGNT